MIRSTSANIRNTTFVKSIRWRHEVLLASEFILSEAFLISCGKIVDLWSWCFLYDVIKLMVQVCMEQVRFCASHRNRIFDIKKETPFGLLARGNTNDLQLLRMASRHPWEFGQQEFHCRHPNPTPAASKKRLHREARWVCCWWKGFPSCAQWSFLFRFRGDTC